jgi:hypothetical protein
MTFFTLYQGGSIMSCVASVGLAFLKHLDPAWEQEGSAWPLSK